MLNRATLGQIRHLIVRRLTTTPKLRATNGNHASSSVTTSNATTTAASKTTATSKEATTTTTAATLATRNEKTNGTALLARLATIRRSYLEVGRRAKMLHKQAFSDTYLLLTNVAISLSLSSAGDVLEQQYEIYTDELESWQAERTAHMAISGVSVGVICHYWYRWLDRRLPGRTISIVIKKIVLDQLICSPIYISAFFVTLGVLERKSPADVWLEMKEKAWKLYAAEWMIWPVAQFVNFYWLPTKYRVFYDNIISLGYDVYTSQVKHHD